jgi:hypothetical protein
LTHVSQNKTGVFLVGKTFVDFAIGMIVHAHAQLSRFSRRRRDCAKIRAVRNSFGISPAAAKSQGNRGTARGRADWHPSCAMEWAGRHLLDDKRWSPPRFETLRKE